MEIVFAVTLALIGMDQESGIPILAPINVIEMTIDDCLALAKTENANKETANFVMCMPILPKTNA